MFVRWFVRWFVRSFVRSVFVRSFVCLFVFVRSFVGSFFRCSFVRSFVVCLLACWLVGWLVGLWVSTLACLLESNDYQLLVAALTSALCALAEAAHSCCQPTALSHSLLAWLHAAARRVTGRHTSVLRCAWLRTCVIYGGVWASCSSASGGRAGTVPDVGLGGRYSSLCALSPHCPQARSCVNDMSHRCGACVSMDNLSDLEYCSAWIFRPEPSHGPD